MLGVYLPGYVPPSHTRVYASLPPFVGAPRHHPCVHPVLDGTNVTATCVQFYTFNSGVGERRPLSAERRPLSPQNKPSLSGETS